MKPIDVGKSQPDPVMAAFVRSERILILYSRRSSSVRAPGCKATQVWRKHETSH